MRTHRPVHIKYIIHYTLKYTNHFLAVSSVLRPQGRRGHVEEGRIALRGYCLGEHSLTGTGRTCIYAEAIRYWLGQVYERGTHGAYHIHYIYV